GQWADVPFGAQGFESVPISGKSSRVPAHDLVEKRTLGSCDQRSEDRTFGKAHVGAGSADPLTDRDFTLHHEHVMIRSVAVSFDDDVRIVSSEEDHALWGPFEELLPDRHSAVSMELRLDFDPGMFGEIGDG